MKPRLTSQFAIRQLPQYSGTGAIQAPLRPQPQTLNLKPYSLYRSQHMGLRTQHSGVRCPTATPNPGGNSKLPLPLIFLLFT